MPIYEYKCASCEQTFEYMQRMSEDPKEDCERCGGSLERLISNTSFQLKGGGWYKDLYSSPKPDAKNGSSNGASPSSNSTSGDSTSSSGSSTESKPAAKADSGSAKTSSST